MNNLIIYVSPRGKETAATIKKEMAGYEMVANREITPTQLSEAENIVFVGALGICVRTILPIVEDKHTDPAVVCVDSYGRHSISVLSGHIGGGNELCRRVARILGADPVVTTQSDNAGVWALDTLAADCGWETEAGKGKMNNAIFRFVNGEPTGLLLDVKDCGTERLCRNMPGNVRIMRDIHDDEGLRLIIAVTPFVYDGETHVPVLHFHPKVLNIGIGCRKDCSPEGIGGFIAGKMIDSGISPLSLKSVSTIELKKDEPLIDRLAYELSLSERKVFSAGELENIEVPNPSEKVKEVTGVWGVAESAAIAGADGGPLLIEKQKGRVSDGNDFTFAVAIDRKSVRHGHIEIVGAGPGDPELVSVRGKRFLEEADLILYAGSLVPEELTHYAKPGCVVRSSASMDLEEQFALMKEFYDRGSFVVRLHTGDPCIYGAIQEQMAFFDQYGMSYHITPGISSFQAAAAELRSQFTIPEKVQTIILTRGEGRTPMPEREKLHLLAKSQSTMCIYLSAAIVEEVQRELLMAYPPETPVAACYKLTWKEQRIFRGVLKDLAKIVRENNLTLTTLLVVGEAIDNREGLSKLYDRGFKHLFRK